MWAAVLASFVTAASVAVADEFSWEISAGGQELEIGDMVEMDRIALDATYYFPPANDERGPHALAAFLSRSSYVGLAANRDEEVTRIEFASVTGGSVTSVSETETRVWSISGRYVLPASGWYAGAGYRAGETNPPSSPSLERDTDIEGYTMHFGKYVAASTSLELAWDSTESRTEVVASACIAYPICVPFVGHAITAEEASIRVTHVGGAGALTYAVSGNVVSRRTEIEFLPAVLTQPGLRPNVPPPIGWRPVGGVVAVQAPNMPSLGRARRYSGAFEVFPTERLGVRAGYSRWDGDLQLDDAYDVSVNWFFVRNVNARFAFARANRKTVADEWSETDTVSVELTARF